jgi:hypothetical protein
MGSNDVGPVASGLDAERDHRRMLEKQQLIGDISGLAPLDQLFLDLEPLGVRDDAQTPDF